MMYSTSDFRKGLKIEVDSEPYEIIDFLHVKPGKGQAFVRTKLRSLTTGSLIDRTFRAGEKVRVPDLQEKRLQFLYREGGIYHFMDMESYEQIELTEQQVGESRLFLKENIELAVLYHNERPVAVEPPMFVELEVADTEPGVRGDTASGGSKKAKLVSGAEISVPLFIERGDVIKVDTRDGKYIERVKRSD
jgi:elongation factor P